MKKVLCFLLAGILCLSLVGCGEQYEDTNGPDDYSLETITDENIIKQDIGASGLKYTEMELGDLLSSSEYSSNDFNGVELLYTTNFIMESDVYVYIGTMSVNSGNFKLAVVCDGEIIKEIPIDTFNEQFLFEDLKGDFSVVVAGESADFEFYMDIY